MRSIGEPVRVRMRARDVSIALERAARNQHPERAAGDDHRHRRRRSGGIVDVSIAVGRMMLRSRITRRAAEQLALAAGPGGSCADQGGVAGSARRLAKCRIIAAHENLRFRRLFRQRQDNAHRAADSACSSQRGLTVSLIKHAHHTFDVDQPGKDSYRHRARGLHRGAGHALRGAGRSCTSCAARPSRALRSS